MVGAIPTENLPKKSQETTKPAPRPLPKRVFTPSTNSNYGSFAEVVKSSRKIKLDGWQMKLESDKVIFEMFQTPFKAPSLRVSIDDSLGFTISVFDWFLPCTHIMYKENRRSVANVTVSALLNQCSKMDICEGMNASESSFVRHIVPKQVDQFDKDIDSDEESCPLPYDAKEFHRHIDCVLLNDKGNLQCSKCKVNEKLSRKQENKKKQRLLTAAKPKAPITKTSSTRIGIALKEQRLKCTLLEKQLKEIKTELENKISSV